MKLSHLFIISVCGLFVFYPGIGRAANYTFTWDPPHPNDNVIRYKIYYRMNSGSYNTEEDFERVPNQNTDQKLNFANPVWKITLPHSDEEYCFTATAIDDDGFESRPAHEVGYGETCGQIDFDDIAGDLEDGGDSGGGGGGGGCFIWVNDLN